MAIAIFAFCPLPLLAAEYQWDFELADTVFSQSNWFDRGTGRFEWDRNYNLLTIAPALSLALEYNVQFYMRGKLQWKYEWDEDQQRDDTNDDFETFLTSAYLDLGSNPFKIIVGLQPVEIGSGLITADDALGLTLSTVHGRWSLSGQVAWVMESSPMAVLTLAYVPGSFERLTIFGAWFRDDEDAFANTLPDRFYLLNTTSKGELWWMGASAEIFIGRARLTLTTAYESGEIIYDHDFGQTRRVVEAYIGDVGLSLNLNTWFSSELFFFIASGDDDARSQLWTTFLSPMAYNPRALIFFDPRWLDRTTTSAMTLGGSFVRGALAPGISATLEPFEGMLVQVSCAFLFPHQAPSDDRDVYGWEIDLQASYPLRHNIDLYLEAARFEYGTFFEDSQGSAPDDALLFSIGCRAAF